MWLDKYTTNAKALEFALAHGAMMGATDRQRLILRELSKEAKRFHLVFSPADLITNIPWADDDNGGLPEWCYEGAYIALEVDLDKDQVEWVPAVGPAPVWRAKFSDFATSDELFGTYAKWCKEIYGVDPHHAMLE